MKILIICSKQFYSEVPKIQAELESYGHVISLPNCINDPLTEQRFKNMGTKAHAEFKATMFRQSETNIKKMDAVLVLNFNKHGTEGYIGGATFLEMYEAFMDNKKIFLYNNIAESILSDEIEGFKPNIINGDLKKVVR